MNEPNPNTPHPEPLPTPNRAPVASSDDLAAFLNNPRATYSVEQAARLLGISPSTAYECAHTGELPVLHMGRRLLVTRVTLIQLLDLDQPATNQGPNQPGRPRRTRWIRAPQPTTPHEAGPDWALPYRRRPAD
jgi:excisionase family DNA binding protein